MAKMEIDWTFMCLCVGFFHNIMATDGDSFKGVVP